MVAVASAVDAVDVAEVDEEEELLLVEVDGEEDEVGSHTLNVAF